MKEAKVGLKEIQSVRFFSPTKIPGKIIYEAEDKTRNSDSMKILMKRILNLRIAITLYTVPPMSMGKGSFVIIKLVSKVDTNENVSMDTFFFVYNDYEAKLTLMQNTLNDECPALGKKDGGKLSSLLEVPIGGMFGVKADGHYLRVRTVKINFSTRMITYWAVDEGKFGTCTTEELVRLTNDLVVLNMLVVPGVFDKDPSVQQLNKLESKKFCMAILTQPTWDCDYAPRKITLV